MPNFNVALVTAAISGAFCGCANTMHYGGLIKTEENLRAGDALSALKYAALAEEYADPNSPHQVGGSIYHVARCREAQGRTAEAIAGYDTVAGRFPDTEYGVRSAARRDELRAAQSPKPSP